MKEGAKLTVMQPVVIIEDGLPSGNVSSEEIDGSKEDITDEKPIEHFGDFDNREDGR